MLSGKIIDISSWQHPTGAPIDWGQVAASGVVGVIVKATQGTKYVNPYLHDDYNGASGAGLMVGAYHYAQPVGNDAVDEAAAFLTAITGLDLELGIALDWDDPEPLWGAEAATWITSFFDAIQGRSPIEGLYIDLNQAGKVPGVPFGRKLWAADDLGGSFGPVWLQQSAAESVPGIGSPTDIDTISSVRGLNPTKPPAPVSGQAPKPWATIRQGAVSVEVSVLQALLRYHGYTTAIDSDFGPLTEDQIKLFQDHSGLQVDGIVGPLTWAELLIP